MADNNSALVGVGAAGKIYVAPYGTSAPTDASTALPTTWQNFGYVSEEGIVISENAESTELVSWGGVPVKTTKTKYSEKIAFTPIEVNEVVLKQTYGDDNVTVTAGSGTTPTKIVASHTSDDLPAVAICVDVVHSDTVKGRYYASNAQLVERGDLTLAGTDAAGRELGFQCNPGTDGKTTMIEFEDILEG